MSHNYRLRSNPYTRMFKLIVSDLATKEMFLKITLSSIGHCCRGDSRQLETSLITVLYDIASFTTSSVKCFAFAVPSVFPFSEYISYTVFIVFLISVSEMDL